MQDTLLPLAVLAAITLAVVWLGWRRRYLAVGWFWYLGMLVPVIGLVQVGAQARADRYTYLTQIGLYIMIAWGLGDLARSWRGRTVLYAAVAAPIIGLLAAVAWMQTSYWQNSLTLWEHSVACQPETNDFAQNEYAVGPGRRRPDGRGHGALPQGGRNQSQVPHAADQLRGQPGETAQVGRSPARSARMPWRSIRTTSSPTSSRPWRFSASGSPKSRFASFAVIEKNPKHVQAHNNLAEVLRRKGGTPRPWSNAGRPWNQPRIARGPSHDGQYSAGEERSRRGGGAVSDRVEAQAGRSAGCTAGLADVLWRQGKFREAVEHRKQQVALQPQNTAMALKVVRELISDPRPEARFGADALEIARRLCEATEYKDIFALDVLAAAYAETGDFDQAEATIRKAMETPLGQKPNNAAELQKRLVLYHAHQEARHPAAHAVGMKDEG